MKQTKSFQIIFFVALLIITSGCRKRYLPAHKGGFTYRGIYFGAHFKEIFKQGIRDGCDTARGKYTKSHWSFNNRQLYADGWFLGRNRCKKLLKIDKNGDLIL